MKITIKTASLTLLLSAAAFLTPARALDTTEVWGKGEYDFEVFVGAGGLGGKPEDRELNSQFVLGYGLADNFSIFGELATVAGDNFSSLLGEFYFGAFSTIIDANNFDLDLFMRFGFGIAAPFEFDALPSIEMNFDSDPDLEGGGGYIRLEGVFARRAKDARSSPNSPEAAITTAAALGGYYAIAEGHKLFLELDAEARHIKEDEESRFDFGGIALGYNVMLTENIKFLNELYFDIPFKDEKFSIGFATGFIVNTF